MPIYDYKCVKCDKAFERFELIATRDEPCFRACPECGVTGGVTKIVGGMPSLNYGTDVSDARKLPEDFKNRLRDLSNKPGVKGTRYADKLGGYF
jgi:putative FmdB family regulatory protein